MRRWNGWGDEGLAYPVPPAAAEHLRRQLGPGEAFPDAPLEAVLAHVPPTRLPPHPMVSADPAERLRHARGQSLPDWVALRSGRIGAFPDGVAYPADAAEVQAVLDYAERAGVCLIPYGGGTSVVGHVNPRPGARPSLTMDLSRLNRMLALDETSRLATFEAGVTGPEVERQLGERGFTLGHYPQSFEYSTLGGWIATRSSGQQSYHYGRIEALFAGGRVITPAGEWVLPSLPASAAGPDLRHWLLGSEGRLGIITQATVRVRPRPVAERFLGAFFHNWDDGAAAVRQIAQAGLPVSMLRLSDADETETTLRLAGHVQLVVAADRGLAAVGYGAGRCLLVYGVTEDTRPGPGVGRALAAVLRGHRGLPVGAYVGRVWARGRFRAPYLRNTLWEMGYALDTVETALPWSVVLPAALEVKSALREALAGEAEPVLVFAHLSHVYADGASLYTTYLFRRAPDPEQTVSRWEKLKLAASQAIVARGGTISHQHGVGEDHAPYLPAEKGPVGMALLRSATAALDPTGRLNPGKLLSQEGE